MTLLGASLVFTGRSATVTGHLTDLSLGPLDTKVIFTPTNLVLVNAVGLSAGPPKVIDTTNGQLSVVLDAGDYTVSLPLIPARLPFAISVLDTNGAVNITNLMAARVTYLYTNPPLASIATLDGCGTNTVLANPIADRLTLGRAGTLFVTNQYGVVLVDTNAAWPRLGFSTNPASPDIAAGPFLGWEPGHPNGGEVHLTSPGALSLNLNYAKARPNSGLQVGSSGAFHDRLWIQYDDDPAAGHGALGRSKVLEFINRYLDAGGVLRSGGGDNPNPWRFGFRQEVLSANGDVNLVLYSAVPWIVGTTTPGFYYGSNAQERAGFPLVRFGTNAVTICGDLSLTNGQVRGGLGVTGILGANLVVSSNVVLYPKDLPYEFNSRIMTGSDAPVYAPDAIAVYKSGIGGRTSAWVPNWVTQAVSSVTAQWSGDATLYWTNRYQSFWYPVTGRQVADSFEAAIVLTNHLNLMIFTNAWPQTNTLKSVSIYQPYAQTNASKSVQILKWRLELYGVPGVGEQ